MVHTPPINPSFDARRPAGRSANPLHRSPRASRPRPRLALVHDWLVGLRGGEWVLDRIARLVRAWDADVTLYTMFADGRPLTSAIDRLPREVAAIGRLPLVSDRLRRWLLPLYPAAVDELSARIEMAHRHRPFDLVISTSSAAVKGVRPPPAVPHLCYCHCPARYLWSQTSEYSAESPARALGLAVFGEYLRDWDRETASNVTAFLANSAHTAREIRRCYGRDSAVVYPPVDTDFFTPDPIMSRAVDDDYWLVVSALEPYKRIDLAIAAAITTGRRLLIAGEGSQRPALEAAAGRAGPAPNIEFLGRIDRDHLRTLYRRARLLLFPQVEDFGIVAVEAQACGCPVVARAAGGAAEIVIDGNTGRLFTEPRVESLLAAIDRCPNRNSNPEPSQNPNSAATDDACTRNAQRFCADAFDRAFAAEVRRFVDPR